MTFPIALLIFSSIALVTCIFLVTYFFIVKKENRKIDTCLGLLFLAIALRISKSVFYYIYTDISDIGVGFGFLGFASIGPLLYFYFKFSKEKSYKITKLDSLHFLFAVIGFCVISFLEMFSYELYLTTKFQLAAYLFFIGKKYVFVSEKSKFSSWHTSLYFGIICLLAVLTFQFFVGNMLSYTIGTALASLVLYVLFFIALKAPNVIKKNTTTNLPKGLVEKIKNAIESDKIYTQPAITLRQFSEAIETPSYLVSKATKVIYQKTFPEVINCFRINEIKQKLSEPIHSNDTIEELAYDVGFNTSSAFYSAFKKETSMTPRAYQKKMLANENNFSV